MTLFGDIVKAAGKDLNNETFRKAGESLTSVTLPGSLGPLHYGPSYHDGNGSVFVYTWDSASKTFTTKVANP